MKIENKSKAKGLLLTLLCLVAVGCTQVIGSDESNGSASLGEQTSSQGSFVSTQSSYTPTIATETTSSSSSGLDTTVSSTLQSEFPSVEDTLAPDITYTTTSTTKVTTKTTAKTTTATTKTTTKATTTTSTTAATTYTPPSNGNGYTAVNYKEMKAVWIAFLEYDTMLKGKNESQFTANIGKAFDNAVDMGLNTVIVHVRAHGDAYYESELFPWASRVTGTVANAPSFDPLEIMVQQAHNRGLSIHAWINPFRVMEDSKITSVPDKYPIGAWYGDSSKNGTYLVKVKTNGVDFWYLNPAYPEVRKLIADGVSEIVSKYDIDGMHIDDYFYPTTDNSFDNVAFTASGQKVRSSWRMENVSSAVKGIYDAVKAANKSVMFGVSPQGNIENNYNNMYADVKKWCSTTGYLDYIAPQIYYGFQNKYKPYAQTVKDWDEIITAPNIKLIVGLAAYKIGGTTDEWGSYTDIIKRQIVHARETSNYAGVILYRYDSIFNPAGSVKSKVEAEIANFEPLLK